MNTQTETLTETTREFIAALLDDPSVIEFRSAADALDNDEEFATLRRSYGETVEQFRQKQSDGTLEQTDIERLRELQNEVNSHPIAQRFIAARDEIAALVQECNQEISHVLGFDFGSVAGPRGGCSC